MATFSDTVKAYVRSIPKGETRSYREVATAVGKPRAYRAVANVMAQNFDETVPCHRVIRADGSLGGYNRGGTRAKRTILELETKSQQIYARNGQ